MKLEGGKCTSEAYQIKRTDALSHRMTIGFSRFTCLTSEDTSRIYYTMEVGLGYQEVRQCSRDPYDIS